MPNLSSEERIILHIERFVRFAEAFDVPFALCQDGIADELQMLRNNVSRTLSSLLEDCIVIERLAHIQGLRRRRKVYTLTTKGANTSSSIKARVLQEKAKFIDSDGLAKELGVGDISSRTGMEPFQVMEIARKGEAIAAKGAPTAKPSTPGLIRIREEMPRCERFVSREREVMVVQDAIASSCVVVFGIAGIGKSTLVARSIGALDSHLFWRNVREWDTPRSLLTDIGSFFARIGRTNLDSLLSKRHAEWGETLASIITDLSKIDTGVIMVFDDVDKAWSKEMRTLFKILLDVSRRSTLRLITTSRKEMDFYDERDTLSSVSELMVEGLGPEGSVLMLPNIPAERRAEVYKETGGHPLYLELVNARGVHEGRRDLHSFMDREIFAQLSEAERRMVNALAVHRIPVPPDAIAESEQGMETLRSLSARCTVTEVQGPAYQLHPVIAQALLERMAKDAKQALNRSAAKFYGDQIKSGESVPEYVIEHAYHLVQCGENAEAVRSMTPFARELIELGYTDVGDIIGMIPRGSLKPEDYAFVLLMTAYTELEEGDAQAALKAYTECLEHAEKLWGEGEVASLMEGMASTMEALKKYNESAGMQRAAIRKFDRVGNVRGSARSHILLGRTLRLAGDLHGAVKEYKTAIELLSKVNERAGLSAAWHNLAIASENLGELREAEGAFRKALSFAGEGTENAAKIHASLADFYKKTGSDAKAEEEFSKARRSSIESGYEEGLIDTELAIARSHAERREWQKGITLLKQIHAKVEKGDHTGAMALRVMELLIHAYYASRDFGAAKEWTKRAIAAAKENDEVLARLHLQLSDIDEAMGNKAQALEALVKGERFAQKIPGARIAYALRKSELQLALGKEDESLSSAKEALATASREREHYAMARAHELTGEAYAKKGEKKLALNEFEQAIDDFERADEPERAAMVRNRVKKL